MNAVAPAAPSPWCPIEGCSERAGHKGRHHTNGIAAATWRRVLKMPVPPFGDHWSCVMRPGAWEWERPEAYRMRAVLELAGYEITGDPNRPYGVAWKKRERRGRAERGPP